MRLDKFVSNCTKYSRTEAKKIIKKGVIVNNKLVKSVNFDIDENNDEVIINNEKLIYNKYVYIMLNKPKNYITATEDNYHSTVLDLISDNDKIFKLFPVGRLDKDTEGLILLTNNGELAHNLLSPKKDILKKYYVEVDGFLSEKIVVKFWSGIVIDNDYKCKKAKLEILYAESSFSKAYITISEGKFHQIKKMMNAVSLSVIYLKRLTIGSLILDESLKLGEYRFLNDNEIKLLEE